LFCDGEPPGDGTILRSESKGNVDQVVDSQSERVIAYPNPAKETLTIEISGDFYSAGAPKDIQLLDINGRAVYQTVISGNSLQINAGGFPSGFFLLKVQCGTDIAFRKVIIH